MQQPLGAADDLGMVKNDSMVVLEELTALAVLGVIIFVAVGMLVRGSEAPLPMPLRGTGGRWQTAYYAVGGSTRVVVRKVGPDGSVVDEHAVATLAEDDPEFDAHFLEAMAVARQRVALFQSEEP